MLAQAGVKQRSHGFRRLTSAGNILAWLSDVVFADAQAQDLGRVLEDGKASRNALVVRHVDAQR